MIFEALPEFEKDLKALQKCYRSIRDDLEVVKQVLEVVPNERPPFSYRLEGLGLESTVLKVKKIACKSLKGKGVNSGLRLIYAWFAEDSKIILVEIYHKNRKASEDRTRIYRHFSE